MSPRTQTNSFSAWWPRHLRAGFGLGLTLGLVDVITVFVRDAKVPLSIGSLGAVVNGIIFALAATLFAALTFPLFAFDKERLAVVGSMIALTAMAFFNLLGLWVYWMTGTFPTLAPVQMLWVSPSQFLHAGLRGQEWRLAVLLLVSIVIGALLLRVLRRAPQTVFPLRRYGVPTLACAAGVILIASSSAANDNMRYLQRSTPEIRWLVTLAAQRSVYQSMVYDHQTPAAGAPLDDGSAWLAAARASGGPRPNVLLVMLESLPLDHLGFAGYSRPVSPHLDQLAASGWNATNAWSTASQSNYAQTAILSSQLPIRRPQLETYMKIDYPRVLFHDLFGELGYQTAIISSQNEHWQGMSRFLLTGKPVYFFHAQSHPGPHLGRGAEQKLPDHLTVDHFFQWLEGTEPSRPWAVYLNFQRTHFPYEMPAGFTGPYQPSDPRYGTFSFLTWPPEETPIVINRYDNAVEYVDRQIGRIVEHLEASGQAENTLLLVLSDHGEQFGEHGLYTHGNGLQGKLLRVPMVLYWPGHLEPREIRTAVSTLDLLPTMLDLLALPPHPGFQGSSFLDPAAHAARRPAQFATLQGLNSLYGVVCDPWKLVIDWSQGETALRALGDRHEDETAQDVEDFNPAVEEKLLSLVLSQRQAQLDYYTSEDSARSLRYPPRLLTCPELPAPRFRHPH